MGSYIPDEIVEEIRTRSDIVEVISERIQLKKSGANYKGLCPFHSEKTPSFIVSQGKQIFHCFGCGTGGNVYQFIMQIENIPFPDAVLYLAKRYGINIPEQKGKGINSSQKSILYNVNGLASDFFHRQLLESPQGKAAREYLKKRGINDDTANVFKIGYASPSREGIQQFFKKKGVSVDTQRLAGLIKEKEDGGGYIDKFRDRIIFPISDTEGRVVGFGGRILNDTEDRPKYLNSPETPVYKKSDILYGLNLSKEQIRKSKEAFLVEGYFDLITAYQNGVKNIIATSGTALTENHAGVLKRYTDNITLLFDGDEAGRSASMRGGVALLNKGIKVKVIPLPSEKDPDNFIKEKGMEGFLSAANGAKPYMEYIIEKAISESDMKNTDGKIKCVRTVLPYLSLLNSSIERSVYLSLLADRTGIKEKAIMEEMNKQRVESRESRVESQKPRTPNPEPQVPNRAERILVQLMLLDSKNIDKIKRHISADDFNDSDMAKITSILFSLSGREEGVTLSQVMDMLHDERLKRLASELAFENIEYQEVDRNISDCIRYIKRSRMDIKNMVRQLKTAILDGNHKQFKELQEQILKSKQNLS
ncbi:MAG: DNA primase [Nitrospinae bacterium]|nr:DNA primase [Nitrospinota bacterium]